MLYIYVSQKALLLANDQPFHVHVVGGGVWGGGGMGKLGVTV